MKLDECRPQRLHVLVAERCPVDALRIGPPRRQRPRRVCSAPPSSAYICITIEHARHPSCCPCQAKRRTSAGGHAEDLRRRASSPA